MMLACWMGDGGTVRGGFETAVWNAFFLTSTRTTVHPLCLCEKDSVISSPGCNPLSAENLPHPPLSMHEYCRTSSFTGQYFPLRVSSRVAFSLSFTSVASKCGVIHLLGSVRVVFGPQADGGSTFSSGSDGSVFPRSGYRWRYRPSCSAMHGFHAHDGHVSCVFAATVQHVVWIPTRPNLAGIKAVSIHPRTACRPSTASRGDAPGRAPPRARAEKRDVCRWDDPIKAREKDERRRGKAGGTCVTQSRHSGSRVSSEKADSQPSSSVHGQNIAIPSTISPGVGG